MNHEITIVVCVGVHELGMIEKTFEGTREEAITEINETIERNRVNNPDLKGLGFKVTLNGNSFTDFS